MAIRYTRSFMFAMNILVFALIEPPILGLDLRGGGSYTHSPDLKTPNPGVDEEFTTARLPENHLIILE